MSGLQFTVDESLCGHCGMCADECPSGIIEHDGEALPTIRSERENECVHCQHCLAVCPTGALSIQGRDPAKSLPLSREALPSLAQMTLHLRGRRSIRNYQEQNVPRELLDELLSTLANVPTGCNCQELTFTVIDDRETMQRLREKTLSAVSEAGAAGRIPEASAFLLGAVRAYRSRGADAIFRGAPHALIVSAPASAPCAAPDVVLTLAYFDLLAQSAGLGTVWWGMLKVVLETLPELKPMVGLQGDHAYYAMLFGLPAIEFARTVQRDDAATIRRLAL